MICSHRFFAILCALTIAYLGQVTSGQDLRANPPTDSVSPMATPRPKPDERLHVQLKDGSLLVGKLAEDQTLQFESVLGKVDVPTGKLTGIYFLGDGKARIAFRNGDMLTGELQNKQLKLQASWGAVAVDVENVEAVISHDQVAAPGATIHRTFFQTEDGIKVQWQMTFKPMPVRDEAYHYPGAASDAEPEPSSFGPAPPTVPYPVPAR